MSILLLNLRNVPDDEADAVRALLDARGIACFETRPSRWGVSAGAIWLADDTRAQEAAHLIETYQAERLAHARAEHAAAVSEGTAPTWWSTIRDEPIRVLLALVATALVLGLLALPAVLMSAR